MSVSIAPIARQQFVDSSGNPATGDLLFTYAAGSTTKQTTYTTSTGLTANANPIVLDSEGKTPYGVWLTDGLAYKFVLAPSTDTDPPASGVTLGDNILGSGAVVSTGSQWLVSNATPTYVSDPVLEKFTLVGDKTTDFHVGRRLKLTLAAGTVYGFIIASSYGGGVTTVAVQLDSGNLDSGLTAVELGILTATNSSVPAVTRLFSAVNDIINGQFRLAQAGTSFAAAASGDYDLDGWLHSKVTTAVVTIAQSAGGGSSLARTSTVTTADAAIAAGDYFVHETRIEGYDAVKYLGQTFTIGFWVASAVIGRHCVSIYNGTSSYILEYTINVADTFEYKTITVSGGMTALNSATNAYGFSIRWANMCGATFQSTVEAWNAGNFVGTSAQVNDVATIGNVFWLKDVTLNMGTTVTGNDISIEQDLARCQRQYQLLRADLAGYNTAGNLLAYGLSWPTPMRTTPTAVFSGGSYVNASGIDLINENTYGGRVQISVTGTNPASASDWVLTLSARL